MIDNEPGNEAGGEQCQRPGRKTTVKQGTPAEGKVEVFLRKKKNA